MINKICMIAPSPSLKYPTRQCLFGMNGLSLNEFCFLNAPESDLGRTELVHWGQVLVVPQSLNIPVCRMGIIIATMWTSRCCCEGWMIWYKKRSPKSRILSLSTLLLLEEGGRKGGSLAFQTSGEDTQPTWTELKYLCVLWGRLLKHIFPLLYRGFTFHLLQNVEATCAGVVWLSRVCV